MMRLKVSLHTDVFTTYKKYLGGVATAGGFWSNCGKSPILIMAFWVLLTFRIHYIMSKMLLCILVSFGCSQFLTVKKSNKNGKAFVLFKLAVGEDLFKTWATWSMLSIALVTTLSFVLLHHNDCITVYVSGGFLRELFFRFHCCCHRVCFCSWINFFFNLYRA